MGLIKEGLFLSNASFSISGSAASSEAQFDQKF